MGRDAVRRWSVACRGPVDDAAGDECDPSWVNGFLFGFALVVGGALAVAVPLRLRRLAAAGAVSWGRALAHVVAGAPALLLLYSLLDAVLPRG